MTASTKSLRNAQREADEFYATSFRKTFQRTRRMSCARPLPGMLWSKQFYHYVVKHWLEGDPGNPPPPPERRNGRNHEWTASL